MLPTLPAIATDYVFIAQELRGEAERWLSAERADILATPIDSEDDEEQM